MTDAMRTRANVVRAEPATAMNGRLTTPISEIAGTPPYNYGVSVMRAKGPQQRLT